MAGSGKGVPLCDIQISCKELRPNIDAAVARVLDSGQVILGPEVAAFESEVADSCGVGFGVGCGSGSDALSLALHGLGIGHAIAHHAKAAMRLSHEPHVVRDERDAPRVLDAPRDDADLDLHALGRRVFDRLRRHGRDRHLGCHGDAVGEGHLLLGRH